jgi:hypothetical protein
MSKDRRQSRRDRMMLEGEIFRPRGASDGPIGIFAIQLALARWLGRIFERRKAENEDNG